MLGSGLQLLKSVVGVLEAFGVGEDGDSPRWVDEKRVVKRLQAKLQDRIMEVSGLGGFLGDPNQGGCPEDVVGDWAGFAERHKDKFCYDDSWAPALISRFYKPSKNPDANPFRSDTEMRVVHRLEAKLKNRIMDTGALRAFLGDPKQGGGRADLAVVSDWSSFFGYYREIFCFDDPYVCMRLAPGQRPKVGKPKYQAPPSPSTPAPNIETRVVQRLQFRLQNGPATTGDLWTFLGDTRQGGGAEDLGAVPDIESFVRRHADKFCYNTGAKSVSLRSQPVAAPVKQLAPPPSTPAPNIEARVVQRLQFRLQNGPISVSDLRSFLGNPHQGGGPEDLEAFGDMEAFLKRHSGKFILDEGANRIGLRDQPLVAPVNQPVAKPPTPDLAPRSPLDPPRAVVVTHTDGLRAMCKEIMARSGMVPLLNFVTIDNVDTVFVFCNADAVYVVDTAALTPAVVSSACQPLFVHPGILKAAIDSQFVSLLVHEVGTKIVDLLDVILAFEHLTGTVDVETKDFVKAFGGQCIDTPPVPTSRPLQMSYAKAVAGRAWGIHTACSALIAATRSENWGCLLSASTQRFQYLATAPHGARRVAFDRRCGHRLATHELLMATAPEDIVQMPKETGSGYSLVVLLPARFHDSFAPFTNGLRTIVLEQSYLPQAFGAKGLLGLGLNPSLTLVQNDVDRICEAIGIPTYVALRGNAGPRILTVAALPGGFGHASATRNTNGKVASLVLQAAPPIFGVVPLLMDIVVGRPDLNVLMVGMGGTVLACTLRSIASVLSEIGRVLLVGSAEFLEDNRGEPALTSGQLESLTVPHPEAKGAIIASGANAHRPSIIVVDEIASRADVIALCDVMRDGIRVIAGVRRPLTELAVAPDFFPLFGIEGSVDGRSDSRRRTMTPPVGCIVTLQKANECTVMLRVADTVDRVLDHGACPPAWVRTRDADGVVVQRPV